MFRSLPLTLFWFVYMGSVGIVLPYYSLYLKENAGLSGTELGWAQATGNRVAVAEMVAVPLIASTRSLRSGRLSAITPGMAFRFSLEFHYAGFVGEILRSAR